MYNHIIILIIGMVIIDGGIMLNVSDSPSIPSSGASR